MKKRIIALFVIIIATALPMHAGFDEVASALEHRYGFSRTWIPLFGVVRFGIRIARPNGVHDVQLAVYENQQLADPRQIEPLLRSTVGRGYTPLVRVRSNRTGEWTFIFARPAGANRIDMIVFVHDHDETVLLRVDVDAETVTAQLGKHEQLASLARP